MQEQLNSIEKLNDFLKFGKMLSGRRFSLERTHKEMALRCKSSESTITSWENSINLAPEDKLPDIALAYEIDLNELKQKWEISKKAREKEKTARRNKSSGKTQAEGDMFSGRLGRIQDLIRTNEQTQHLRSGRK